MKIHLRYFASLREQLGSAETVDLPDGLTVGQLRDQLLARSAAYAQALSRARAVRCALNQTLCKEDARLTDGDELAFFPPVTGG